MEKLNRLMYINVGGNFDKKDILKIIEHGSYCKDNTKYVHIRTEA